MMANKDDKPDRAPTLDELEDALSFELNVGQRYCEEMVEKMKAASKKRREEAEREGGDDG